MALRADRLTTITTQHHTVLNLVLILSQHLEESIDTHTVVHILWLCGKTMPEHVFLGTCQTIIRLKDGEIALHGTSTKLILPHLHLITVPALHTTVIHAQGSVRNDQSFINADNATEALTGRTGTQGGVEGEHVLVGLLKGDAVSLVTGRKIVTDITWQEHQTTRAIAFI